MGNIFGGYMEESLKRNQEFMQSMNKIQMERQIQMQCQMQERQMALMIARNRDMCLWITAFYVIAGIGMYRGYRKTQKPFLLAPMIPLTFITLYNWDLAYGNKLHRVRKEAEHIMTHEAETLGLPCGLPTAASIDLRRIEDEKKRIKPVLPLH